MTNYPELHYPKQPDSNRAPVILLHGGNVANWMWEPQVAAFEDRLALSPHLPGFGARVQESWPGLEAAADDMVARVTDLGVTGRFDLVGLSLGAAVSLRILARQPERVKSAFITGTAVIPAKRSTRMLARLQLAFWSAPWFWHAQARAFGLPEDSREAYVEHGLSVRRETAAAMLDDVLAGGLPEGLASYTGPLLAVAGEKDSAGIEPSLGELAKVMPDAQLRIAPGMHHVWNIEDNELFNAVMKRWLDNREIDPRLRAPGASLVC